MVRVGVLVQAWNYVRCHGELDRTQDDLSLGLKPMGFSFISQADTSPTLQQMTFLLGLFVIFLVKVFLKSSIEMCLRK